MNGLLLAATLAGPAINFTQALLRLDPSNPDVGGQLFDNMNMFQGFGNNRAEGALDVAGAIASNITLGLAGYTLGRVADRAIYQKNATALNAREANLAWAQGGLRGTMMGGTTSGGNSKLMELMLMGNFLNSSKGMVLNAPVLSDSQISSILR